MRYERPTIVRREQVLGLLTPVPSSEPNDAVVVSDVHQKEHIVAVAWGERYEAPAVAGREAVTGLLSVNQSDVKQIPSDVHRKEHIVPVAWGAPYEAPAFVARDAIAGLLRDIATSDKP